MEPTPPPPAETAQEPVKEGASRPAAKKLKRKRAAAEEGEQGTPRASLECRLVFVDAGAGLEMALH